MALHNQNEIDQAWSEVILISRYGDKAHYRVNSITKAVYVKTRVGDGNAEDWRMTNVSYTSIVSQPHELVTVAETSFVPTVTPIQLNGNELKPIDLESVAPLSRGRRKQSGGDLDNG